MTASAPELEPVIGLEIHVQLKTRTKMFCGCELSFGDPPNVHTCPVCLGLPGTLPVLNARAVHYGLMIGLALECDVAERSVFHRKNYFYPDLPKGYQISQYDLPLCRGGRLEDVRIHRVHLEEDAAKLIHAGASGRIHGAGASLVDFNRGGTPLVEIVAEPDIHSPEEANAWLKLLRTTLRQLGASDVNMEQGSLRCDANVSLRPVGSQTLGVKTELKNMNSFRFIERGLHAEIARQRGLIGRGQQVVQETIHFDPVSGELTSLRSKEEAHDYRYFPEPDLVPLVVGAEMLDAARAELPELPAARAQRYETDLSVTVASARLLAFRPELGEFFERARAAGDVGAQALANWVTGELVARVGDGDPADTQLTPAALATLVALADEHKISQQVAKQLLDRLVAEGGDPVEIVAAEGLEAVGEGDQLAALVAAAIEADPDAVAQIRAGKERAVGALIGYVMRETKGRADGGAVTRLVREQLGLDGG